MTQNLRLLLKVVMLTLKLPNKHLLLIQNDDRPGKKGLGHT